MLRGGPSLVLSCLALPSRVLVTLSPYRALVSGLLEFITCHCVVFESIKSETAGLFWVGTLAFIRDTVRCVASGLHVLYFALFVVFRDFLFTLLLLY